MSNWIIGLISELEITEGFLTQELDPKHSIQGIVNSNEPSHTQLNRSATELKSENISHKGIKTANILWEPNH